MMPNPSNSNKRSRRRATSKVAEDSPSPTRRRINIFISYSSEDSDLISSIVELLNKTFLFALFIYRDVEIMQGQDYAKAIDRALDDADILLVILTGRMKTSHSYTGFEVGYFTRSIRERPIGGAGFERIYIPFCIGADIPDALHFVQGVRLGKDDAYKVSSTKIEGGAEPDVDEQHPISKFLTRIYNLVMQVVGPADPDFGQGSRFIDLSKPASELYRIIHEYLQTRVSSETYPERKLTIRTPTRPEIGRAGVDLTNATVELVGDFSGILSVTPAQDIGRQYSWSDFCEKIPKELRSNAVAGIQLLTAEILKGGGDNYHVVTTAQRDKAFRLFVSKVITYVSQKTEVDIYIVQMRTKEYGDPLTTRLLKAASVGLRFRFLVLEDQSEFRPEKLGHPIISATDLKVKVSEMLGQMDLILREAADANLSDPELLILIWGKGKEEKVQAMMDIWEESRKQLYATADEVLCSVDDGGFRQRKDDFVEALKLFCRNIEQMNQEFTSNVLSLLVEQVQPKLGKTTSGGDSDRGATGGTLGLH